MLTEFSQRLLDWYARYARQLPWRIPPAPTSASHSGIPQKLPDAYRVWISEVMLQQTRIETVIPYYERWLVRFPALKDLAVASEQQVLSAWEGMGYYGRARNLWRAACLIFNEFNGHFPSEPKALEQLPGIGHYTAAAIASIAFGKDEPALDGNIRRVLARLIDLRLPARSPKGEKQLLEFSSRHLPPGRAGDYNQALMDLGATICLAHQPVCLLCPVATWCKALELGVQKERPVNQPRPAVPHYTVTAAVIERDQLYLIARRPSNGLLGGLWEFPGGKQKNDESLEDCLSRELLEELGVEVDVGQVLGVYRHAYTHFKVTLHAFCCTIVGGEPRALQASELRWVNLADLKSFPMGKIDRMISLQLCEIEKTHHQK